MNYQHKTLPAEAEFTVATPVMTEKTILKPILQKHMAPKGKLGYLVVRKGALQFVWEDTGETLDAAPDHPIVIEPERFHHVKLTGPVEFTIEFYKVPHPVDANPDAVRPGEQFLK